MVLSLKEQIVNELDKLSPQQQENLLRLVKGWQPSEPIAGTPGQVLLDNLYRFDFAPGAVDEIMQIIEEDCEQIDWNEWQ